MTTRNTAADELVKILDTSFLRAITEPARLEVLKVMLLSGGGDVSSIAEHLPQDRSVISRHLQALEDAGIVRSEWQGRHRQYRIDGSGFVNGFEAIAEKVRALTRICCPPSPPAKAKPAAKPPARKRSRAAG